MTSLIFKQELYLKADNEQETAQNGLLSFVDISRSGIQLLKRNKAFKAIEFLALRFPFSSVDATWSKNVLEVLGSDVFKSFIADTEVSYSLSDPRATLVPSSLYSEKEQAAHFELLFGTSDDQLITQHVLSNADTTGVFSIPKGIAEVISTPIRSSYLHWLDALPTSAAKARVNLVLDRKQFALVIQKEGKLIFSNWFEYAKNDDVLYYLMASLETLKILHSDVEVILSGRLEKGDEIHSAIAKFISKLTFGKRPTNLTYGYSFKGISEHQFPFIFSATCA